VRFGFEFADQLAGPIHQAGALADLFANPQAFRRGFECVGIAVRGFEEFYDAGGLARKVRRFIIFNLLSEPGCGRFLSGCRRRRDPYC
jgi:hypothetical protein